jgi:hypothetical protein
MATVEEASGEFWSRIAQCLSEGRCGKHQGPPIVHVGDLIDCMLSRPDEPQIYSERKCLATISRVLERRSMPMMRVKSLAYK